MVTGVPGGRSVPVMKVPLHTGSYSMARFRQAFGLNAYNSPDHAQTGNLNLQKDENPSFFPCTPLRQVSVHLTEPAESDLPDQNIRIKNPFLQ